MSEPTTAELVASLRAWDGTAAESHWGIPAILDRLEAQERALKAWSDWAGAELPSAPSLPERIANAEKALKLALTALETYTQTGDELARVAHQDRLMRLERLTALYLNRPDGSEDKTKIGRKMHEFRYEANAAISNWNASKRLHCQQAITAIKELVGGP